RAHREVRRLHEYISTRHSMASGFEGKSDADIIAQSEAQLNDRSNIVPSNKLSADGEEANVSNNDLSAFPTTDGIPQTSVGRTGQTGGGTSSQLIPAEEGGDGIGSQSTTFEGRGGPQEKAEDIAAANPGSVDKFQSGPGSRSVQNETISSNTLPEDGQPQLIDQSANPLRR
ncbi:uncharacterized protein L969DRAFT_48921, partial [Mixia osmundae IAM 14324]